MAAGMFPNLIYDQRAILRVDGELFRGVAPFFPRAIVIADIRITEKFTQHEPDVRTAYAGLAVGDDLIFALKTGQLEQPIKFSGGEEGAIGMHRVHPVEVDRAGNMTANFRTDIGTDEFFGVARIAQLNARIVVVFKDIIAGGADFDIRFCDLVDGGFNFGRFSDEFLPIFLPLDQAAVVNLLEPGEVLSRRWRESDAEVTGFSL